MGPKKILSVTAVEVNDSLTIAARMSITTAEGQECSRSRELYYDVEEESCCLQDWLGEIMGTLEDPNEEHAWVYEHGPGCEQHEGGHHGE